MIHTYRDADVFRTRYWDGAIPSVLSFCFLVLFLFGPLAAGWFPFNWTFAVAAGAFTVLALVAGYNQHRREQYGNCGEIRLDDDGTCELETKRRVIRIHASEIQSVKYWRDSESEREHYTIHYRGGKLHVAERMTGFRDFLTRLKTLNPAVDLASFPALLTDAWPTAGGQATEERTFMSRFLRSALFPLIVISMLVYLAIQTIPSK